MPIKQDNRLLAIKTPLGPDVLAVRSATVQEQIGRLFHIEADLASENSDIDFDQVIGKPVTLRLHVGQKDKRYFSGIVSRFVQGANQGGYASYRAVIVPWLWLLTRTSDCRIFLDKTVPDILKEVFSDHELNDYQLKLSGSYEKKEFCVQYRETDFNFVSRLMEQEGIYYYFEHKDGKHTMVIADSISAHKPFAGYADIAYYDLEQGEAGREVITHWTVQKEAQPVAAVLNDFDFKKPKTSLKSSTNVPRGYGMAQAEVYDYPGEYVEHGDGERLADVRLNELQTQYETLTGQASARGLAP
jgi:type VI secretion system secreted protein VgrG